MPSDTTPGELPIWERLPRPCERDPRTGLTRSVILRLCAEGKVRSVTLRPPGQRRGCRVYSPASLLAYLAALDATQNPTTATTEAAE